MLFLPRDSCNWSRDRIQYITEFKDISCVRYVLFPSVAQNSIYPSHNKKNYESTFAQILLFTKT